MANPSQDYIDFICSLYNSSYDDRIENTAPPTAGGEDRTPGEDWVPGVTANHKSLIAFQKELKEQGIRLSTSKIKKILVTGGLWTTQQTRTIQEMFGHYTGSLEEGGEGEDPAAAIKRIADELGISTVSVSVSLPYMDVVYNLPEPSANAKRCRRWKERKAAAADVETGNVEDEEIADERSDEDTVWLWKKVIEHEGETFTISGRGSRPGTQFTYTVSRSGGAGGRHYEGVSVDGYGNELWVTTNPNSPDAQKLKKSISRSTVELGYQRVREMGGVVKGPKALGLPGAGSYLYPMLVRFGVIKKQGEA